VRTFGGGRNEENPKLPQSAKGREPETVTLPAHVKKTGLKTSHRKKGGRPVGREFVEKGKRKRQKQGALRMSRPVIIDVWKRSLRMIHPGEGKRNGFALAVPKIRKGGKRRGGEP